MELNRCAQGHLYDPAKHTRCPYCEVPDLDVGKTRPKAAEGEAVGAEAGSPPKQQPQKAVAEPSKTVGIYRKEAGVEPVVGWLVCIEGPDRGQDYRIHSEKNFIGRSQKMDLCIAGDERISRENHASIGYDPKKNSFKLYPGDSRGLVYLNSEEIDHPTPLNPYDRIELGASTLVFVPFCGETFKWE